MSLILKKPAIGTPNGWGKELNENFGDIENWSGEIDSQINKLTKNYINLTVSSDSGNDNNDGVSAPLATVKRALELARESSQVRIVLTGSKAHTLQSPNIFLYNSYVRIVAYDVSGNGKILNIINNSKDDNINLNNSVLHLDGLILNINSNGWGFQKGAVTLNASSLKIKNCEINSSGTGKQQLTYSGEWGIAPSFIDFWSSTIGDNISVNWFYTNSGFVAITTALPRIDTLPSNSSWINGTMSKFMFGNVNMDFNNQTLEWVEPAYQNGYETYGSTSGYRLRYAKDSSGLVFVNGRFLNPTNGLVPQVPIFTLPVGYRPTVGIGGIVSLRSGSSGAAALVIETGGNVRFDCAADPSAKDFYTTIVFRAA